MATRLGINLVLATDGAVLGLVHVLEVDMLRDERLTFSVLCLLGMICFYSGDEFPEEDEFNEEDEDFLNNGNVAPALCPGKGR